MNVNYNLVKHSNQYQAANSYSEKENMHTFDKIIENNGINKQDKTTTLAKRLKNH